MDVQPADKIIVEKLMAIINKLALAIIVLVIALVALPFLFFYYSDKQKIIPVTKLATGNDGRPQSDAAFYWTAPSVNIITDSFEKKRVLYGRELIAHTSKYLGPKGNVLNISNGLNCQNCHLQAGTMVYGNNYGSVAALYPKFRARSGTVENIYKRINDCIQRSLNGTKLDTNGREIKAMAAYINFLGSNVEKGKEAPGSGLKELDFLLRSADTIKGKFVYMDKCQLCHQQNGEGVMNQEGNEYIYPALWGQHSFNDGAGLYRLSNIARFIKYNMPQGITYKSPLLTDEEAWDVAAFISSQPRPHGNIAKDWPDIYKKPFDSPFGPYADKFSEHQHKYGPFKEIKKTAEAVNKKGTLSALK